MQGHISINERTHGDPRALLKAQSGLLALTMIANLLILSLFQVVGAIAAPVVYHMAGSSGESLELINECYTMLVYLCTFLLPYLWYARAVDYTPRALIQNVPYPPVLAASVGIALAISVAGLLLTIITALFFSVFGLYPMELPIVFPKNPIALALYMINMTVLPALVEEFIMRGIVMGSLRRFGDRFAVVISALLFGLLHRNMTQFPNAFLLGLAIGYFVIKTNSLWTGVAIHFINNLLAVALTALTLGMTDMQAWAVQGFSWLLYIAAGVCGFLYLRVLCGADLSFPKQSGILPPERLYRQFLVNFPMLLLFLLFGWLIFLNFSI